MLQRATRLGRPLGLLLCGALVAGAAAADAPWVHAPQAERQTGIPSTQMPGKLRDVGFDQNLGAQVPVDLVFRDETGHDVTLQSLLRGKPVILFYEETGQGTSVSGFDGVILEAFADLGAGINDVQQHASQVVPFVRRQFGADSPAVLE